MLGVVLDLSDLVRELRGCLFVIGVSYVFWLFEWL